MNGGLAKLNDGRHVFFLDLGPKFMDENGQVPVSLIVGPHPTAAGYEIWAAAIKEPLANLLKEGSPRAGRWRADRNWPAREAMAAGTSSSLAGFRRC